MLGECSLRTSSHRNLGADLELTFFSDLNAEAVNNIIKFLGMQPCERSDKVPENKNSHTLYLAGTYSRC